MTAPKRENPAMDFPFYCKSMISIGGTAVADGISEGKS
jgi:hypothetical protein